MLVVEEADALGDEIVGRIASEGRRLGISMCLLTQHPTEIGGKALSQMGTQIMGRTTDAADLDYIERMAGEKSFLLYKLKTGEWVVNGVGGKQTLKVLVRDRYSHVL